MEIRVMQMGQIWRCDGHECILLNKIGTTWLGLTMNQRGHNGGGVLYLLRPNEGEYIPNCFYWCHDYSTFVAENPVDYFRKVARKKHKIAWHRLWE